VGSTCSHVALGVRAGAAEHVDHTLNPGSL
jgi:hypothetical protein